MFLIFLTLSARSYSSVSTAKTITLNNKTTQSSKLHQIYHQWAGTRYLFGGTSKKGIDCSAFVQTVINKAYNVQLPRTTQGQKLVGKSVAKSQLKAGDLVFFRGNKHVGVYVGNNKFIHSSSKKGVIMADLNKPYYQKVYTQARRII